MEKRKKGEVRGGVEGAKVVVRKIRKPPRERR